MGVVAIRDKRLLTALKQAVDTGADATVVPIECLDRIQAPMTVEMWARGKWEGSRRVNLFLVDVHFGESVLPHVQVVGDEVGDKVILGYDVLNKLKLLLDSPAAVAHVSI